MFVQQHLQYHVQDTPRRTLQQLFNDTCVEAFTKAGDPVSRMIVAYKEAPKLPTSPGGIALTTRRILFQTKGLPSRQALFLVLPARLCVPLAAKPHS
jgi:hypothetical protein